MTTKSRIAIPVLMLLVASSSPAIAVDGASLELITTSHAHVGRVGLQWKWKQQRFLAGETYLGAYWDASLANWRATRYQNIPDNIHRYSDVGVAAVFRLQQQDKTGFYAEAGTGPHYLSDYYDNSGRRQGSRLVFNSHAGIGFVWKNGVDIGFRAMHVSNGSIRSPNDAINLYGMGVRYWW